MLLNNNRNIIFQFQQNVLDFRRSIKKKKILKLDLFFIEIFI